jgi:hypothetical protein
MNGSIRSKSLTDCGVAIRQRGARSMLSIKGGMGAVKPRSRARKEDQRALDDQGRARLKEIIRTSPRSLGYETSLWTLTLLAEVSFNEGLTT